MFLGHSVYLKCALTDFLQVFFTTRQKQSRHRKHQLSNPRKHPARNRDGRLSRQRASVLRRRRRGTCKWRVIRCELQQLQLNIYRRESEGSCQRLKLLTTTDVELTWQDVFTVSLLFPLASHLCQLLHRCRWQWNRR